MDLSKKKFEVKIHFVVEEMKDGVPTPFVENALTYHDIGYDGVVGVENALMQTLDQLNDWGVTMAMENGLGERMSMLGLGEKVAALSASKAGG